MRPWESDFFGDKIWLTSVFVPRHTRAMTDQRNLRVFVAVLVVVCSALAVRSVTDSRAIDAAKTPSLEELEFPVFPEVNHRDIERDILVSLTEPDCARVRTTDIGCLACNIYHEARGEPMDSRTLVALVTMNRVRDRRFPGTVCRVVWQPYQFSWTNDGKHDRVADPDAWNDAVLMADLVLLMEEVAPMTLRIGESDVPADLLYYHEYRSKPSWIKEMQRYGRYGSHVAYRSPPD